VTKVLSVNSCLVLFSLLVSGSLVGVHYGILPFGLIHISSNVEG
jgi:hypothetical protein